ncbi:PX domain-containing protein kinase-like protein isoform X1 [Periophthalmus magnuspinnatus]|uniref:PX domain-containing protein kinase-like protein isoform X1 n=1 Tax=Periophthalmus magnuspinnatus TaxID=409849 RepID=UPI00145A73FB|nr:PX domain-containing protein kinase-like protein isoform X1 [Periophthalmus magnuspinnatus]XP_055080851.1 PX domain-containing protein kinase-like protein isoform X1 [Periophthalmus magnuspinnatus]
MPGAGMSSYLETPSPGRQLLDDTIPLSATIEASQNLQSHTEYIIRVQRGVSSDNCWQVIRRYSDFDALNSALMVSGISLPLPPKKLIGNMDREFIAERQRGLQAYLDYITQHPLLCSCLTVKRFLDPNNYATNYTEIALQQVSMFFRSDPKWEVQEPLKDMGWRIRKKYFMIKNKEQPKERYLLSWVDLGPDKFLSDKDLQSAIKLLSTLPSSVVVPLVFSSVSESSALIIRPFSERGSLRDHICKVKPRESYLKKYCNPKKSQGLDLPSIKLYGRTILEALRLLHSSGLFCGHLHCCNVLLEEGSIRLVDLENGLLGTPSAVRPLFTQFRKVNTTESIDVFSFGLVLFEMTYGWPPDSVPIDQFSDVPHPTVGSVLQSLLSSEALKFGLPSVSALLQTPLFSDVPLQHSEKQQFKVPSRLKEALKSAKENLERRLQEEQRQLHQHRRLTRAQSHHCSDEERKRRKLLARKKSRQSAFENEEEASVRNNNNSGSGASSPPTCPSSPTPPPTGVPPPPPPLGPPPAPLGPPPAPVALAPPGGRTALLSSIQTFSKVHLKKAETVDRSQPII